MFVKLPATGQVNNRRFAKKQIQKFKNAIQFKPYKSIFE